MAGQVPKGAYSAFKSPKDLNLPKSANPMSPCKNLFWAAWEFYAGLADAVVPVHRAEPRQSHTNPSAR